MPLYIKVCPKCRTSNDETTGDCSDCGTSLFGLQPVLKSSVDGRVPENEASTGTSAPNPHPVAQPDKPAPSETPMNGRLDQATMLTLRHLDSGLAFNVLSGDVVGQKHPTSQAHVQISGMNGVDTIHRQHCRFIFREAQWYVQPIDQRNFRLDRFTNPTHVDRVLVPPGTEHPIRDGNRLTLGEVVFNISTLGQ